MSDDLVQELETAVRGQVAAARERGAATARDASRPDREAIMDLLGQIRRVQPDYKLADLEALTDGFYERAAISKRTAHIVRERRACVAA
jgi:hypothetical protein